jgi:hypothetical protein
MDRPQLRAALAAGKAAQGGTAATPIRATRAAWLEAEDPRQRMQVWRAMAERTAAEEALRVQAAAEAARITGAAEAARITGAAEAARITAAAEAARITAGAEAGRTTAAEEAVRRTAVAALAARVPAAQARPVVARLGSRARTAARRVAIGQG